MRRYMNVLFDQGAVYEMARRVDDMELALHALVKLTGGECGPYEPIVSGDFSGKAGCIERGGYALEIGDRFVCLWREVRT